MATVLRSVLPDVGITSLLDRVLAAAAGPAH